MLHCLYIFSFRSMDLDQMSRRIVQDVLEIVDPDYYEFEGELVGGS